MIGITQGIGEVMISTLGTMVAIILIAIFLIWSIKEIVLKNPKIVKWVLMILFICFVVAFTH